MDQGNDAVHVREILDRKQILLRGPETGIKGVYHGALWYYYIAIGYLIFDGHPFGSVFMLILLNLALTAIITIKVASRVSKIAAIIVGSSLQFYWWFYDTSRYGFNPFPLAFLSVILIFLLVDFIENKEVRILGKKINPFVLASIPIGLAFHCESAAAVGFTIFYFLLGLWSLFKKKLNLKLIFSAIFLISLFFIPRLISEIKSDFSQSKVLRRELSEPKGVFSETRFLLISRKFSTLIARRITPQSTEVGIAILVFTLLLFIRTPNKHSFIKNFTYFSLFLIIISWIWFGSNKGWQIWHTVYFRPLLFMSVILMLLNIRSKLAYSILVVILISQIIFFKTSYLENFYPSSDASILKNEIDAVDWVYRSSDSKGFHVYSYLPSVYDYPYQYLFWWHGRKEYGYVPCEYSTYPKTPDLFIPGLKHYQEPKRECTNLRFLIIEPDKNQFLRDKWLEQTRSGTRLVESKDIGSIKIEKREIVI